jgi:molybdate transport system permease protein
MTATAGDGHLGASPREPPGPRPGARGRVRAQGIPLGSIGLLALAGLFALFLALPVVVLVGRSLANDALVEAAGSSAVLTALGLSLVTTAISLALTIAFGLPLAIVLAKRSFRGKWLVEAIVDLPIVLPPSVAGLALLLVFGRRGALSGPLGATGVDLAFTTFAVILAQTFVSAPFFIRAARTGIAAVDHDLEDAARVDGASERQVFRLVTTPLAGAALAAGMVLTWARALGEFGATIMFAGNVEGRTQTLPLVVYAEFQGGDLDASIAAAAILVLAALAVLLAVRFLHAGRVLDVRSGSVS